MSKKIKINVTQEHIDSGRPVPEMCPVALALRDATGEGWRMGYVFMSTSIRIIPAPRSVRRWVKRFDLRKPVRPFAFWLKY
jgi:hypothetical protein